MDPRLLRLSRDLPLPAGFAAPERFSDVVSIDGVEVHRAGLQVRGPDGVEVTGSAAEVGGDPLPRAWYELLERAAIVRASDRAQPYVDACGRVTGSARHPVSPDAGAERRAARSNGVALHRAFEAAREAALLELIERDRVLGSWYGELPLRPAALPERLRPFVSHEWVVRRVDDPAGVEPDITAVVVVGFPRRSTAPLARGFAAGRSLAEASEAAAREALQNLAFLWDEPVPMRAPEAAPTPLFHLDYYLVPAHHEALRAWLDGEAGARRRAPARSATRYLDLTPPSLSGRARVVRALATSTRPLVFGAAPAPVAPSRRVHPVA